MDGQNAKGSLGSKLSLWRYTSTNEYPPRLPSESRQDKTYSVAYGQTLNWSTMKQSSFYKHDVDWSNRLILGDSLLVMNSLATREDMAGRVQMIYVDPPYGIGFRSNFQPLVNNRSVSDRDADLTREPEMVKAYRDTWTLGVHTYLTYLRDRLTAARPLAVGFRVYFCADWRSKCSQGSRNIG